MTIFMGVSDLRKLWENKYKINKIEKIINVNSYVLKSFIDFKIDKLPKYAFYNESICNYLFFNNYNFEKNKLCIINEESSTYFVQNSFTILKISNMTEYMGYKFYGLMDIDTNDLYEFRVYVGLIPFNPLKDNIKGI